MEWTKGPWHVRVNHPGRSNTPMYFIAPEGPEPGTAAVARVLRSDSRAGERKANAHLIAAAPEMYEALTKLLLRVQTAGEYHRMLPECNDAEAALAKARGE